MDAREYLVPIPPLERWKRDVAARPTPFTDGLRADAPEGARSVRLFVLPYAPFAPAPEEPTRPIISPFLTEKLTPDSTGS